MAREKLRCGELLRYMARVKEDEHLGEESVGLAFLAACNRAIGEDGTRLLSLRVDKSALHYLGVNLYHLLMGTANYPKMQAEAVRFLKRVPGIVHNFDDDALSRTMTGAGIKYVHERNPGYVGLGEVVGSSEVNGDNARECSDSIYTAFTGIRRTMKDRSRSRFRQPI